MFNVQYSTGIGHWSIGLSEILLPFRHRHILLGPTDDKDHHRILFELFIACRRKKVDERRCPFFFVSLSHLIFRIGQWSMILKLQQNKINKRQARGFVTAFASVKWINSNKQQTTIIKVARAPVDDRWQHRSTHSLTRSVIRRRSEGGQGRNTKHISSGAS